MSITRSRHRDRPRVVPPLVVGAVTGLLLVAFSAGYGYHRDELYFVAAGEHLDWAYPDQGVVTPLVARAMSEVAPHSLTVLRLPSAVAAGLTVLLTALLARELGGGRRAELVAAGCAASATIVLFTGHLLSTSTFDLLVWTAVTWLVVRAVRTDAPWLWLVAGAVLGIGLMNKPLPAFLAAGLLAGIAVAGPRRLLAAVVSSWLVSCVISLPVLPADDAGPVVDMNDDVGETIGWPELVRTVARVHRIVPTAAILTRNYGEAGAVDRYGPALGLPGAYSGHNAYGEWGPPPAQPAPVVAVGFRPEDARPHLRHCAVAARIDTEAGVDMRSVVRTFWSAAARAAPGRANGPACVTSAERPG